MLDGSIKSTPILAIALILSGCLQYPVTSESEFRHHTQGDQRIQVDCIIRDGKYVDNIIWGSQQPAVFLDYENPSFPVPSSRHVPIGTEIKILKIEKRNLVDHGTEILAFGVLKRFPNETDTPIVFELTEGLGGSLRLAPWEKRK